MSVDPFEYDDAAYVLGALSPQERVAFENHLRSCDACTRRVREISDVPAMLSAVTFGDLADLPVAETHTGPAARLPAPMPETLLPGLLRRASNERRRQRSLVAGLAAVAAACLIAIAIMVWPSNPSGSAARQEAFRPVLTSPVRATAVLTDKSWGTAITVHCHYLPNSVSQDFSYQLVVHARNGGVQHLGTWTLPRQRDIQYASGTALPRSQIASLDITLPDGTTILRLDV